MENIMSKVTNLEYKKTDVWQHFSQDKPTPTEVTGNAHTSPGRSDP